MKESIFKKFNEKIYQENKDISKKLSSKNIKDINDVLEFCKKNNFNIQKYNSIVKSLLDGDFSEDTINEKTSNEDNKLIKEELLKNRDVKDYLKSIKVKNYDEIISLIEKSIKEKIKYK